MFTPGGALADQVSIETIEDDVNELTEMLNISLDVASEFASSVVFQRRQSIGEIVDDDREFKLSLYNYGASNIVITVIVCLCMQHSCLGLYLKRSRSLKEQLLK